MYDDHCRAGRHPARRPAVVVIFQAAGAVEQDRSRIFI